MRLHVLELAAFGFIAPLVLLTGCSTSFAPGPVTPEQTPMGAISGTVYGGQQPILGATVTAYSTSTSGYGTASTVIATTTTDPTYGFFSFPAATTCTEGTVVYLYSLGGKPVVGQAANSAAGLMAVVGTCPSTGTLAGTLVGAAGDGASVQIYMNEVSTVAAAYALAGFAMTSANVSTSATAIGTNGDALAQTGIQNAGANAAQMYTAIATADGGGTNPGATRGALQTTPGTNGTVPYHLINTIANILAACINSTGSGSSACTTLFANDKSGGGTSGTEPTDTATAAIYLAQHPFMSTVGTLYAIVGSAANPFMSALTSAPSNFVVELIFTGAGLGEFDTPPFFQTLAIDGSGNVWLADDFDATVSKFSNLGVALGNYSPSACGFADGSSVPSTVAINAASTQTWVGMQTASKICVLNSTGGEVTNVSLGSGDGNEDGPYGIAFDSSGNGWAVDDLGTGGGSSSGGPAGQLYKVLGSSPYTVSELASGTTNGLNGPTGIAIESPTTYGTGHTGDIWVANFDNALNSSNTPDSVFSSTGGTAFEVSGGTTGNSNDPNNLYGSQLAIDSNGYAWTVVNELPPNAGVAKTKYDGSTGSYFVNANAFPFTLAIDGAGNVWYNSLAETGPTTVSALFELNNSSGSELLSATGYTPVAVTSGEGSQDPDSIAVDGSGDVWYDMLNDDGTLRELIGAAVPVATPIAYGVANNKLGARP